MGLSVIQTVSWLISKSVSQSVDLSVFQTVSWLISQSVSQSMGLSVIQMVSWSISQSVMKSISQPVSQPFDKPWICSLKHQFSVSSKPIDGHSQSNVKPISQLVSQVISLSLAKETVIQHTSQSAIE